MTRKLPPFRRSRLLFFCIYLVVAYAVLFTRLGTSDDGLFSPFVVSQGVIAPVGGESVLTGTIRDSQGAAVPRAELRIGDHRVLTDSFGRFELRGLQAGQATIEVGAEGYQRRSVQLRLESGDNQVEILLYASKNGR